ncbi:sodium channel protein Nach-like [Orussus abietinus]|uniref:sodium channel protein Nach-like n=1 Tax=Orussus abietinus TaxID=222816 RepID=UPI000C7162D9|nr:sodium channel protein Nach-like [Orussus abietinus]
MVLTWQRFEKTPTVTTIDTTTYPIWGLHFPAVTICNYNKVYRPEAKKLAADMAKEGLNVTEIKNFFDALPKLIRPEFIGHENTKALRALERMQLSVDDLMLKLMQPCDKLLMKCIWLGKVYNCSKIFKTVKSIEGYCCAFNYHVFPSVTLEQETDPDSIQNYQQGLDDIQMVPGAGRDIGLSLVLNVEAFAYRGSIRPYTGASVLIHDPHVYPEVDMQTALVQSNQEISVILSGKVVESAENVRQLKLNQRNCWFNDEKQLKSSVVYSYQSCVAECRMEHIVSLCDCLPFYYPDIVDNVRTCGLADVRCLRFNNRVLSSLQMPLEGEVTNKTISPTKCACLPQCSSKSYVIDIEKARLEDVDFDSVLLRGLNINDISLVHVHFRDITCLKYRRDSLITWHDLLASFGGVFGLCVGGSFVSFVEILYYFTIKVFHSRRNWNDLSMFKAQSTVGSFVEPKSNGLPQPSTIKVSDPDNTFGKYLDANNRKTNFWATVKLPPHMESRNIKKAPVY